MPDTFEKQVAEWAKKRRLYKRQFDNGASVKKLADTHGMSYQRMYVLLKKEGATFRSYGSKK